MKKSTSLCCTRYCM